MTGRRGGTIGACAIVAAYLLVAAAMGLAPDALAKGTPGLPGLPLVVALHVALFLAIVLVTMTMRSGDDA